ncbi:hypothetical protein [Sphaerisporangium dianthi]|uniref:Dynamin family protein n=1 Tax=Sphaerisporangium dianthi TaxID=1436120 RepID=A0ABV9CBG4_9ACTN
MTVSESPRPALEKQPHVTSLIPELLSCLGRLESEIRKIAPDHSMEDTLRSLALIDLVTRWNLASIAGDQGIGKTELASRLFPAAAQWLVPAPGQGERVPVAIVHRTGAGAVSASTYLQAPGPQSYRREAVDSVEAWHRAVRGQDESTLMCLLELPAGDGWQDGQGVLLLPGFERADDRRNQPSRNERWQRWMREALGLLPVCVAVTGEQNLALDSEAIISLALIEASIERQVVVARYDDPDDLATVRERAAAVYDVRPSSLFVLSGDEELGRLRANVQESLGRLGRSSALSRQAGRRLRDALFAEVKTHLDEAARRFHATPPDDCSKVRLYQKEYQSRFVTVLRGLGEKLPHALEGYMRGREELLVAELKRTRFDDWKLWLSGSPEAALRLRLLCERVYPPADVRAVCDDVIASVAELEGRSINFAASADTIQQTLNRLAAGKTEGLALTTTARALPYLALNAQRMTRAAADQRPTSSLPQGAIAGFDAFSVFLWPDHRPPSGDEPPRAAAPDLSWIMVMLGAAGGGLVPVLLSTLLPQVIGMIKKTGWNRGHAARSLLAGYQDSVTEATIGSVRELLDVTFTAFESLYRQATGLDAQADQSLHHLAVLNKARTIQDRMLMEASWR